MSSVALLDGRVAIVTRTGQGISRSVALPLARKGAAVVVNDLGAQLDGSGSDSGPAQLVTEITEVGGRAVESIVKTAIGKFGWTSWSM